MTMEIQNIFFSFFRDMVLLNCDVPAIDCGSDVVHIDEKNLYAQGKQLAVVDKSGSFIRAIMTTDLDLKDLNYWSFEKREFSFTNHPKAPPNHQYNECAASKINRLFPETKNRPFDSKERGHSTSRLLGGVNCRLFIFYQSKYMNSVMMNDVENFENSLLKTKKFTNLRTSVIVMMKEDFPKNMLCNINRDFPDRINLSNSQHRTHVFSFFLENFNTNYNRSNIMTNDPDKIWKSVKNLTFDVDCLWRWCKIRVFTVKTKAEVFSFNKFNGDQADFTARKILLRDPHENYSTRGLIGVL